MGDKQSIGEVVVEVARPSEPLSPHQVWTAVTPTSIHPPPLLPLLPSSSEPPVNNSTPSFPAMRCVH